MWFVIKWLMFISVTLIAFDIIQYFLQDKVTQRLINDPLWLNDLIISLIRTLAYMSWAIPIFYLFWPSIISRQRREDLAN